MVPDVTVALAPYVSSMCSGSTASERKYVGYRCRCTVHAEFNETLVPKLYDLDRSCLKLHTISCGDELSGFYVRRCTLLCSGRQMPLCSVQYSSLQCEPAARVSYSSSSLPSCVLDQVSRARHCR